MSTVPAALSAAPRAGFFRQRRRSYRILTLPALIVVAAVIVFPWLFTVYMSAFDWKIGSVAHFVGLGNYTGLLTNQRFLEAIVHTFYFTALAVVFPLLLGAAGPWFVLGYVLLLAGAALYLRSTRGWRRLEAQALTGTIWVYLVQVWFRVPPERRTAATVLALAYFGVFAGFGSRLAGAVMQVFAALAIAGIWAPGLWPYVVLALVIAASGLVFADRGGSPLPVLAAFWVSFAIWYAGNPVSGGQVFWFATAAFALFAAWLPWRTSRGVAAGAQDMVLVAFNAGVYFAVSYYLLGPHWAAWRGLLAVLLAAVHIELAWRLSRRDARAALFAAGVACALLVLAAPAQFSGYRLTVVWALEAAALAWIGARVRQPRAVEASFAVFALALIRLLLVDSWAYPPSSYSVAVNGRFVTFLLAAACLWAAARWLGTSSAALMLYVAGHFAVLWALALEVFGWAARNAAAANVQNASNTGLSILMAAYALLLVGIGVLTGTALNRALGLGLIAIVVAKLYLYDVWQLGLFYRMAAFAVSGVLLLVMSYVYSRWRQRHAG
jgi:hypothetical protein